MKNYRTVKDFDRIEAYLGNRLTQEERSSFESQLKSDKALQKEVARHQKLHKFSKEKELINFATKVQEAQEAFYSEEETATFQIPIYKKQWFRVAAVFMVLLMSGSLFWWAGNQQPETLATVFEREFKVYPVGRGVRTAINTKTIPIGRLYAQKKYDSIIIAHKTNPSIVQTEVLRLYIGCSYIERKEPKSAIQIFKNIAPSSSYYEDGLWYTVMAYLQLEDKKRVSEVLEDLIAYKGRYLKKAIDLKKSIKN